MAINERLVHTASAAAGGGTGNQEEGLILHLDANDVDSYDGDGTEWVDIANHEYTPTTNVSEHFNTVIYNGTGSTSSITELGFQPDLVWIKKRSGGTARDHMLYDSARGAGYRLRANQNYSHSYANDELTSFDADGFSLSISDAVNGSSSSAKYVAWCFKAGGAAVLNEEGTIDSQVSANNDLGFSIVKWSGNDTTGATIGHGMSSTPELTIIKNTGSSGDWQINLNASVTGTEGYMNFNTNGLYTTYPTYYTSSNSTVLSSNGTSNATRLYNNQSSDYIAYCFASKRGVSKVGSYTGTGAAGNKVVTGFEPAFIMTKRSSTSGDNWNIIDNVRDTDTDKNAYLRANLSNEETNSSSSITFNRDGFTLNGVSFNTSGQTHIYYAVAKSTNETSLTPSTDDFTAGSVETTNLELNLDANSYSGSGNWLDGTSNYNNGTITGASYVNDGSADYFSFDGSNDYIDCGSASNIIPAGSNFTIETWVNANNNTTNTYWSVVGAVQSGSPFGGFMIYNHLNTDNWGIALNKSGAWTSLDSGVDIEVGKWVHLAYTYDGSYMKLFVDGEERFSSSQSGSLQYAGNLNLEIGRNVSSYAPVKVGQVRAHSSALTPAQIKSNYEATKIYNTPDLQLNLDAGDDDSTSSNWQDLSSNDYTATFTGVTYDEELGNSYNFVGGSSEVLLNDSGSLTNNANFTVEMWLNSTDNSDYQELWGSMNNAGGARQIYARTGPDDKIEITAYSSNSSNDYRQVKTINAVGSKIYGKWAHLSIVMSNQKITGVYINGESEPITTLSGTSHLMHLTSTTNFGIGGWQNAGTGVSFNGNIGQVRMYHSALTQYQIRQNYNFTKPSYPNGHNGTILGATWNSGGYFTFDGSNDYVQTSLAMSSANVTTSFWFNADATSSTDYPLFFTSNGGRVDINISEDTASAEGYYNILRIKTPTAIGQWNHVAVVFEGFAGSYSGTYGSAITFTAYINGVAVTSSGSLTPYAQVANGYEGSMRIGRSGGGYYYDGQISKVKAYDKSLTQAEVTTLYNEGE
jgi:hypothetical protein